MGNRQADHPSPSQLWRDLPGERRLAAAEAFWNDTEAVEQHGEAVGLLARQMRFRPKTVMALPADKKARYLAGIRTPADSLALRALISYHLVHQRPMMAAFLDAMGLPHEDGLITDEDVKPDASRLAEAASTLTTGFPRDDVALYFSVLVAHDPESWQALADLPETRSPDSVGG